MSAVRIIIIIEYFSRRSHTVNDMLRWLRDLYDVRRQPLLTYPLKIEIEYRKFWNLIVARKWIYSWTFGILGNDIIVVFRTIVTNIKYPNLSTFILLIGYDKNNIIFDRWRIIVSFEFSLISFFFVSLRLEEFFSRKIFEKNRSLRICGCRKWKHYRNSCL